MEGNPQSRPPGTGGSAVLWCTAPPAPGQTLCRRIRQAPAPPVSSRLPPAFLPEFHRSGNVPDQLKRSLFQPIEIETSSSPAFPALFDGISLNCSQSYTRRAFATFYPFSVLKCDIIREIFCLFPLLSPLLSLPCSFYLIVPCNLQLYPLQCQGKKYGKIQNLYPAYFPEEGQTVQAASVLRIPAARSRHQRLLPGGTFHDKRAA